MSVLIGYRHRYAAIAMPGIIGQAPKIILAVPQLATFFAEPPQRPGLHQAALLAEPH